MEPGRRFPGVDDVRRLAEEDLNRALLQAVKNTIAFLLEKRQLIYPDTIHAYNSLMREVNGGSKTVTEQEALQLVVRAADD